MKKIFRRAALLTAVAAFFFAAHPIFGESKTDGASGASLEYVSALLAKNKITRGNFTLEKRAAGRARALKSSGDFVISASLGIVWKTQKPIKAAQVMAKDFALTESAGGKRVRIEASENPIYQQMALLTCALWTDDLDAVKGAADIEFKSDGQFWQLRLVPKDAAIQLALECIDVAGVCSGGDARVTEMKMLLKGGSSASYCMSGHSFGGELSAQELSYFEDIPENKTK